MTEAEFWSATPYQCELHRRAFGERAKHEHDLAMSTAWHTAMLTRAKRIPPLKKLMLGQKAPDAKTLSRKLRAVFTSMKQSKGRKDGGPGRRTQG